MQHLITFDSIDDKKAMLESKWLDRWFSIIGEIIEQSSLLSRETWINVYGMPLIAWGYDNFFNIDCILGRVIS